MSRVSRWLHRRLGLSGGPRADQGQARTRRLLATGSASSVVQVVALVTGLVITPLLVRHLGAVQYGVYATIASTVSWIGLAHIGLGPSVLNELSTARTRRSAARAVTTVSSATAVQVTMAAVLLILIAIAAPSLSVAELFNAPPSLEGLVTAATVIMAVTFALQLPLSLGRTAFEAHQRGYIAQGWELAGHLMRLAAIVVAVVLGGSLAFVVLALTIPSLLVQAGQYLHAFRLSYPQWRPRMAAVSWKEGRSLLGVAADFFILTVASQVIANTDNLVIAHVVGPAAVTPYAVTSRLTQLPTVFVLLALQAAWPAYREAATTDVPWLRRAHRRMSIFGVAVAVLSGLFLLTFGHELIRLWAGPAAVPGSALLAWLVAIPLIQSFLLPSGRMLTSLGATRLNAVVGAANAAINLPVSILLAQRFGVAGVAIGTAIGYVSVGWILVVSCRRRLARLETEWNA